MLLTCVGDASGLRKDASVFTSFPYKSLKLLSDTPVSNYYITK